MWDTRFDERDVKEIRTKTTTYLGVGAIAKIDDIAADLKARGIDSILCVTGGHSYKLTGAWDYVTAACAKHGIRISLYDKVTPNPTTDSIDEAAALGRSPEAKAVLCIGGGSPIDAGKSAAIILANPGKTAEELYTFAFTPTKAVPIVVVNLTHGTGSEVNRFAVASITKHNHKPAIAYDCLYPLFSIDDPGLMIKLSPKQTRYVSIDSVNHVIEAATAVTANPLSILLAGETIRLVAEYLPKSIVKGNPNFYYRAFAPLLFVFYILLYPIVWLTTVVSYVILRLFGCRMKRQAPAADFNRTDLESLIEGSTEVQHDEENEIKLFQNALDFADLRVRDCMVPRIDVEAVELSTSVEELTRRFVESKYSRIFVWEGSIDNIVGYVNSKSLFRQPADLRKVLMTAYFVPETMPLQALLEHFIKHRSYIAVVIDEFGGTAGIISLEDVLEQIFGEIEDEHDEQDMIEKQVDENEYVFSCRLEVKYLNERYGLGIEESREYDTLAGYIISHLDGIPSAGQSLTVDGLEIRVLRTTRSRIELARVRRL